MKTKENFLNKSLRKVIQSAIRHESEDPCIAFWTYQPHRPEKPLPQIQEKK